ncbi:calcium/sodium antiporter [Marinobacter daepoensis]|uniref:Calcium/sodium antiporter n=1 Tax=Marinobacter daepoensis TaxID=262077 RepID=A0ABS3BF48_9GAMM|nr:calcium/sodium antiporter [Marinobacter daepoensis]MBN7770464.1 calcium/sodium antiporter [Marinobacter daepoensis]MBY6033996.1 calcium/sodium antiporter [Marinobacter daepoensis]MBY6079910.1 calcium/sodium antiporter [Marinobacter daepoensis]
MLMAIGAVIAGLILLVWSADKFVDGAAATAKHLGMPTLLIGMVIIGFGTSAPELAVSAMAASDGNPGLALGNGYGSNITNIALIVGLTALIAPIAVHSQVIRKELPLLVVLTLIAGAQLIDGELSRLDGWVLLAVFAAVMGWSIYQGFQGKDSDPLGGETEAEIIAHPMPMKTALIWLVVGLVLLVVSSRLLVWGAVSIAQSLGVSDLVIGLTVVAIGTSLPELASAIAAVKKNEHDLILGNILGSGIFNTLAVVGLAAVIQPLSVAPEVLYRDWTLMLGLTLALLVMGFGLTGWRKLISRVDGTLLLTTYVAYTGYLLWTVVGPTA